MALKFTKIFRENFRIKVVLACVLFVLITCMSFTIFFICRERASLKKDLIDNGKLLTQILAHTVRLGVFSENPNLLKDPISAVFEQQEVAEVSIFNQEGMLLKREEKGRDHARPLPISGDELKRSGLIKKLADSASPMCLSTQDGIECWSEVFSRTPYAKEEALLFDTDEYTSQHWTIGFVRLSMSNEPMNKRLYGLLWKAIFIALGAVIVGSAFMFVVIKGITKPLNTLATGIKKLGEEGVAGEIPVETEDEIGNLARAFNEMSASLRKRKAEKLRLETQLRQAQKLEALGTLAGGIAHDFNNVLTPILGYTEMAMDMSPKKDGIYKDLGQILKAALRARDLVKHILDFSRQSEEERTPMKMQYVIKEALKLLRATLPTTITMAQDIDEKCGAVLADPTSVHSILMNLCTNAYYAMKEKGGQLKVTLKEIIINGDSDFAPAQNLSPGKYVELTVSDTGEGMDKEVKDKIFDPYFTTKPPGEGTGMGLAVVHGIVKRYGGDVTVQSESGKGATFQLYFPVIEREPELEESSGPQELQHGNERILVIDDEAQIAYLLAQMLEQMGYHVTTRTSSIEALEAFAAQPDKFDLIITDQTMPNLTGDQLADEIKRIREDIPIIVCTGFSEKITPQNAGKQGFSALLMKPVGRREMAKTIRDVLDNGASGKFQNSSI